MRKTLCLSWFPRWERSTRKRAKTTPFAIQSLKAIDWSIWEEIRLIIDQVWSFPCHKSTMMMMMMCLFFLKTRCVDDERVKTRMRIDDDEEEEEEKTAISPREQPSIMHEKLSFFPPCHRCDFIRLSSLTFNFVYLLIRIAILSSRQTVWAMLVRVKWISAEGSMNWKRTRRRRGPKLSSACVMVETIWSIRRRLKRRPIYFQEKLRWALHFNRVREYKRLQGKR